MLTGKDFEKPTAIENIVKQIVTNYFASLDRSIFTYRDEIYSFIKERVNRILKIGKLNFTPLSQYELINTINLPEFTQKYEELSLINYNAITDSFDVLQDVSESIASISDQIARKISYSDSIITAVENELKQEMIHNSIKQENILYDSILSNTLLKEGNLNIDTTTGIVTLPVTKRTNINYNIIYNVNKPKGKREIPSYGEGTFASIENGYFHNRMFSTNPKFEITQDGSIERIKDNDVETALLIEYNSFYDDDYLEVEYIISTNKDKVDLCQIVFEPLSNEAVVNAQNIYPVLTELTINTDNTSTNIKDKIVDNRIIIDENEIGAIEDRITHGNESVFPTVGYFINEGNIDNIRIKYKVDIPQTVYYPEKILYNYKGDTIHTFNYYETLVLNNYITPADRKGTTTVNEEGEGGTLSDPWTYYTPEEINNMRNIIATSYSSTDNHEEIYRYSIGIKDLQIYKYTFQPSGYIISENVLPDKKTAASVEIFVNDIIKPGTSIKYFVSTNKSTWYQIDPSNTNRGINKRIVFAGFEASDNDYFINEQANSLYVKIEMTGNDTYSPVLNSYALKVKYI